MKEDLLPMLAEPGTGKELELDVTEYRDGEIWAGSLRAIGGTGRTYPIHSGIPRFVPQENYTDSFGLQWNYYSTVQLDSANGANCSRRRFETETCWTRQDLEGKTVFDGGCGCGRFAEIAADLGAQVIALDYSSAIDAAARNLARFSNVHYVQGDLLNPPIRKGTLDFAYSIGVLQHTPDPAAALRSVLELLAPGGSFTFSIYARRWYTKLNAKYLIRPVTKRIPPAALLRMVRMAMPVMFPLTDVLFRIPYLGKLAQFTIPIANYVNKTEFTRAQRYQEAELDTFDMLSPAFDSPMTWKEVEAVFADLAIEKYRFINKVPINVVGSVPGHRPEVQAVGAGHAEVGRGTNAGGVEAESAGTRQSQA